MWYDSSPIKYGFSALDSSSEPVFSTIVNAFRRILFPSTRKTLEDRLSDCAEKADAERHYFAPILDTLDAVLNGVEIYSFNWKTQD